MHRLSVRLLVGTKIVLAELTCDEICFALLRTSSIERAANCASLVIEKI